MTCKHTHAIYRMVYRGEVVDVMGCYLIVVREDNFGYGDSRIIQSARCNVCSAVLAIGPSNDAPADVQVEILAAEVGQNPEVWRRFMDVDSIIIADLGRIGARDGSIGLGALTPHAGHAEVVPQPRWFRSEEADYWAGWLAREIATHDEQADLLPPADPIGLADTADGGPSLVPDVIAEQTRHDVAASVARHADLETARDLAATRITGRVPYAADQLPLPVMNAPALPPLTAAEAVLEAIYSSLENVDDETKDRELARAGIRRFEVEPLAEVATDTRLKALEAGQVELALAPAAPDALPSRLRQARGIANLGLSQAARKLEIPSSELEDIEQGKQEISEFDLLAFADAYSVSLVWLTSGAGQPRSGA